MGKILHFSACRGEEYFTAPHNTSRRGGFSFIPVPSRPPGETKLALLGPISTQTGQNSPSTAKTAQNQRFFASRANFFSVSPRIQTCSASFLSPISIPGFTLAGRYAHSPNLAWCAHTPQGRWHTGRMTDAPTPRTRTNEPAQASSLPSLAITGASGNVGGTAARLLAERGLPLRLLANTPSRAPELPGAIAVKCSYEDTLTTRVALKGVDVLFMVSAPESEDRLDKHIAFVNAAAASGVRHIVYLSFMNAAPDSTFTLARTHFHTEEYIKASGMTYTFLRDSFYADFFVALPDEEGRILGPAGDGRVGVVAREDAGRVAAGVLADPRRYENQTLDVTGPEALTLDEIAAILTRVWSHPVTYVRETVEEAYKSRKKWPAAQWEYDSWVSTYTSIARGEMDVVSTTVRDVTGRDPLTFEEVARAALASGR